MGSPIEGDTHTKPQSDGIEPSGDIVIDEADPVSADDDLEPKSTDGDGGDKSERLDETILGRYKILDVLGRGAFSIVYRAAQVGVGRIVALKVFLLHPASRGNAQLAEAALLRFQREARLASGLRHPNTVTLYDYDRTETNILYMAFEFVDGPTLSRYSKAVGARPPEEAIHIARQVALSLQEAHDQGIIHRDLKPGNIIVVPKDGPDPLVKVLDFGIAKVLEGSEEDPDYTGDRSDDLALLDLTGIGDSTEELTLDGRIVGTPRYIPPEQIQGRDLGPSADIYALGLILHEVLAGCPANPHKAATDLITWHLEDHPMSAPAGFALAPGLAHVVEKATQRDASLRYQTCAELIEDLDKLDADGNWKKPERKRRAPLLVAVVLNVALLVALGAIVVSLLAKSDPPPEPKVTPPATAPVAPPVKSETPPPEPKKTEDPVPAAADIEPVETQLSVTTEPDGAEVWLGDMNVGTTPVELALEEGKTSVTLTLKKRGYRPQKVEWTTESNPFPVKLTRPRSGSRTDGKKKKDPKGNKKYHILK